MLPLPRISGLFTAVVLIALLPAQLLLAQAPKSGEAAGGERPPAQAPRPGTAPGNSWFAVTELELGTYFGEGTATGTFQWKNPNNKPVDWKNLTGSCQCIHVVIRAGDRRYELRPKQQPNPLLRITKDASGKPVAEPVTQVSIEPNEVGEVEVHLDMQGITGPKLATLDIHSTDPMQPQLRLKWTATGATLFAVSPQEVNLNKMAWSETREFTASVVSPLHKDWNIVRMDDAGKAFNVTWEKAMSGDLATWTIKGTYGPVDGETAGGGVLKFHTDVRGNATFTVRVMAFVQGPLEIKPGGFLTLGMIRKGTSLTKEIVFEPNDGTDLAMTGFHFEKATVAEQYLTVKSSKDGLKLVVVIEVANNAPVGLLKGDLVVELNHPLMKEKRIMFNGFIR